MHNIDEIGRLTLYEYDLLMTGWRLGFIDKEHDRHWQAYLNREVTTTEIRNGKEYYVYKKFQDFFDYEKVLRDFTNEKALVKDQKAYELMFKANL